VSAPSEVRSSFDSKGLPWLTSFAVIGDFGNVSKKENNLSVERVPANYVGEAIRQIAPDFIVSLGDDNYVEGERQWKDFNVGKNYAPYIYPYTVSRVNRGDPEALAFAADAYLADQVKREPWNRFFTAPGNHEVGMSNGKGFMQASGRRDWSHDGYYKAALEHSKQKGSVIPIADSYVYRGDTLYYDYSYGTFWMPTALGYKEGAMDKSYYDYILKPINKQGVVLGDLANIYMVDRNNTAYGSANTAYASWEKKNGRRGLGLDPQAEFLMSEAKKRDGEVAWQIFASHYQTFSSTNNLAKMNLPFFASGFHLVMGSHVHNYERIRAADSAGIQGDYIVNGAGGYNTSYYFSGKDWGASQLFSPVGTAPGFQAGSSGKWGFGLVDMNQSELMYRQFVVDFTPIENSSALDKIIGVAVDAYHGIEPISQVKITEIDRLILRKNQPATVAPPAAAIPPASASLPVTGPAWPTQMSGRNRRTSQVVGAQEVSSQAPLALMASADYAAAKSSDLPGIESTAFTGVQSNSWLAAMV
jgi:hypothetical protein